MTDDRDSTTASRRPARRESRLTAALLVLAGGLLLAVHLASAAAPLPNLQATIRAQHERIAANPSNPSLHKDLGNLLALAGDPVNAEQAYLEALRLDPEDPGTYYNLGLLLQSDRPHEALRAFQRSVRLEPRLPWAHYSIGTLHQRAGRRGSAIEAFARAFQLDSTLALADVNPQVIDNPEAMAALLQVKALASFEAPREYDDPRRLAALLVTSGAAPGAATPIAAPIATPIGQTPAAVLEPTLPLGIGAPGAPAADTAASAADPGPTTAPPPVPAAGTAGATDSLPASQSRGRRRVGAQDLPELRGVNQTNPTTADPADAPATGPAPRFRPGRRSSAQLGLGLEGGIGGTVALDDRAGR